MKIYTTKGDKGTTGLFGGSRVDKDDVRVECIGTLDEANSTIGLLRVTLGPTHDWQPNLQKIQKDLMDMMSHLARPSDAQEGEYQPDADGRGAVLRNLDRRAGSGYDLALGLFFVAGWQ